MSEIAKPCACSSAPTLIFACSGAADVGEIADLAARRMMRDGHGKMFCLAGIGGRVDGIMKNARAAGDVLAIDGCPLNCAKDCLEQAGIASFRHVQLADLGMEKGKSPATDQRVTQAAAACVAALTATKGTITDAVRNKYASVAVSGLSSDHEGVRAVAQAFGYTPEELASIPAEANMGLSCGNPTAFASLKPGEVVVDLGSGGGLDVFLAAQKVGPAGKAIGIDMTPEMIQRAKTGAASTGLKNVEFHMATIDKLPLPDASVDCVISNCVINLAPDKSAVFREIARVLKPGGRLAASDIALKGKLPDGIANSLAAYVGCISGAIRMEEYRDGLLAAGFQHVEIVDSGADLNAYAKAENQSGCCSPAMAKENPFEIVGSSCCSPAPEPDIAFHDELKELLSQFDINSAAASVKVFAVMPSSKTAA